MTKDELLADIEREWEALQAAIDGLTDSQMTRLPVAGEWTVKDLLAHIAVCESLLVTSLYKVERGVPPAGVDLTPAQVDRQNAQFYQEQKGRPLERVLEDLYDVHLALVNRLDGFSEAMLADAKKFTWMKGRPLSAFVAEDSVEHYREHTADILAWRAKLPNRQDSRE
jgi:uncharacterized protein (TIGR03083 family)